MSPLVTAVVANQQGEIFELEGYAAVSMSGIYRQPLRYSETRKLPYGSELMLLPDRLAILYNIRKQRFETFAENPYVAGERIYPVAAFNSPGFVVTGIAAFSEADKAKHLPLFSYGAVGWYGGEFRSAVFLVDREKRQDLRQMPDGKVQAGIRTMRKRMPTNRLRSHLEKCALTYGCPAGKNFFLGRYEAPLPTAQTCNSRCLGCLSLQKDINISHSQNRIDFTPTPKEIAEVALAHNGTPSFPIIATINGQTLHNHYHGNTIQSGDLFLLDAGAETEMCYAGDLSSTFPVDPTFTPQQKEIYQLCLDAHMATVSMLRPGTSFKEVHLTACRTIFEGLKAFGLTKGDTEEAVEAGAHAMFFPCGTGHMMGLDVHDMENLGEQWVGYDGVPKSTQFGLKSLRLAKELKPGYVLTIEPGIYFIPDLMDHWKSQGLHTDFLNYSEIEKFRDFGGLRNEEDFLITPEGARRLGKALPLTIEGVEAVRRQ